MNKLPSPLAGYRYSQWHDLVANCMGITFDAEIGRNCVNATFDTIESRHLELERILVRATGEARLGIEGALRELNKVKGQLLDQLLVLGRVDILFQVGSLSAQEVAELPLATLVEAAYEAQGVAVLTGQTLNHSFRDIFAAEQASLSALLNETSYTNVHH